MASSILSVESNIHTSEHRSKRRKLNETQSHNDQNDTTSAATISKNKWRTQAEQQIYFTKLLEALRRSRRATTASAAMASGREVRDTADRVLAVAAKGTTRWSRAILRRKLKLMRVKKVKKRESRLPAVIGDCRRTLPALERKVKVLGRLVPGCKKAPLMSLLEEAGDYIAALDMQVKAMTALAELLSAANGAGAVATATATSR